MQINPVEASYPINFVVNLSDSTTGVAIYYTVDGSTTTAASPSGTSVTISEAEGALIMHYSRTTSCKQKTLTIR